MSLLRKIALVTLTATAGCGSYFDMPKPETFKTHPCLKNKMCGDLKGETYLLEQRTVQPMDGFESMVRRNLKGYSGDVRPLWEAVREINYSGIPLSKVMLHAGDQLWVPVKKL